MALAQTPTILRLDEPTTHLDIGYQWEVMELLERLNRQHGVTVLMARHDLQHAAWFSDWLVVMQEGRAVAQEPPGMERFPGTRGDWQVSGKGGAD
jgi:iron complex transport system ATP-binding protein